MDGEAPRDLRERLGLLLGVALCVIVVGWLVRPPGEPAPVEARHATVETAPPPRDRVHAALEAALPAVDGMWHGFGVPLAEEPVGVADPSRGGPAMAWDGTEVVVLGRHEAQAVDPRTGPCGRCPIWWPPAPSTSRACTWSVAR